MWSWSQGNVELGPQTLYSVSSITLIRILTQPSTTELHFKRIIFRGSALVHARFIRFCSFSDCTIIFIDRQAKHDSFWSRCVWLTLNSVFCSWQLCFSKTESCCIFLWIRYSYSLLFVYSLVLISTASFLLTLQVQHRRVSYTKNLFFLCRSRW